MHRFAFTLLWVLYMNGALCQDFTPDEIASALDQARQSVQGEQAAQSGRAFFVQDGSQPSFRTVSGSGSTPVTGHSLFTRRINPIKNTRLSQGGQVLERAIQNLRTSRGGAGATTQRVTIQGRQQPLQRGMAQFPSSFDLTSGPSPGIQAQAGFSRGSIQTFQRMAANNCDNEPNDPCDHLQRYRRTSGQCNNLVFRSQPSGGYKLGAAFTAQGRFLTPSYEDGVSAPRTRSVIFPHLLPNAREVSRRVHSGTAFWSTRHSVYLTHFAQFIDHDVIATPTFPIMDWTVPHPKPHCCVEPNHRHCFNINFPPDPLLQGTCIPFVRSEQGPNYFCVPGPRLQLNQQTSYIDGSMIYGPSLAMEVGLRRVHTGHLITNADHQLKEIPNNPARPSCFPTNSRCFEAGDHRNMETPTLTVLHIAFLRRHNMIVDALVSIHPTWSSELVFQEAKRIVIAELQHITYGELLPKVLDHPTMIRFQLYPSNSFADPYSPFVDPRTVSGFGGAAYRFGHSLVRNIHNQQRPDGSQVQHLLQDHFERPQTQFTPFPGGATEGFARWMANHPKSAGDRTFVDGLQNNLFRCNNAGGPECLSGGGATPKSDLAALNIQRGRDYALPPYTVWRYICTGRRTLTFTGPLGLTDHSHFEANILRNTYRHVDDIDLFTGGMSETRRPGAIVGPTFACIIGAQFSNYKRGDRFWHERPDPNFAFTPGQLQAIKQTTLAKIICATMPSLTNVRVNIMDAPHPGNPTVNCNQLRSQDILSKIPFLWNQPLPPNAFRSANDLEQEAEAIRNGASGMDMAAPLPALMSVRPPLNPAMRLLIRRPRRRLLRVVQM